MQTQVNSELLGKHAVQPPGCHHWRQVGEGQHPCVLAVEHEVVVGNDQRGWGEQVCERAQSQRRQPVVGVFSASASDSDSDPAARRPRPAHSDQGWHRGVEGVS